MQTFKRISRAVLVIGLVLALAACAPENLDITPTPTATNTPIPTPTRAPTNTPDPNAVAGAEVTEAAAVVADSRATLDLIIAAAPARINAGAIQWNRSRTPTDIQEQDDGTTAKLEYTEAGGGLSELTFGVFETPEGAQAYYDRIRALRTLERADVRDDFPLPNAWGRGTYGSEAIFLQDLIFVRISVPRFSSTTGDPLLPYARQIFGTILPAALGT
ncbi:MAG: hypothetical protein SGI73_22860 [Chloroflexota bacterium]|nr:hypothetical protein [Chloroflexota bacterium]